MAATVRGGRKIEVMRGVYLAEVVVPHSLVGRTIAESRLRQEHGIEVVLIRLADGAETEDDSTKQPSPTTRLQAGDRLRVMGTAQALGQLDQ